MVTYDLPQQFDLDRLKRMLGGPTLLGDEKMDHFDEFVLSMAAALDPGDMAAHVLVYQYAMETWALMRYRRLQGHLYRVHGIRIENKAELAKAAMTSEAEAEAFAAQQTAHAALARVELLITQSTRRCQSIHVQISVYRLALAEKLRLHHEAEERRLRIKEKEYVDRYEEELQALIAEKNALRASRLPFNNVDAV